MVLSKKTKNRMGSRKLRRRTSPEHRLRIIVALVLTCLAVPLYVLFDRIYAQLRQETLYEYRLSAEQVVHRIDDAIMRQISREENRPFAHYGFFSVEEQKLLQTKGLALSPLSRFPVPADIPGLIGYFQIDPKGVLSSPLLPDITEAQLKAYNIQVGAEEYAQRLALRNQIEAVLKANQVLLQKSKAHRKEVNRSIEESLTPDQSQQEARAAESATDDRSPTRDAPHPETEIALRSTYHGPKLEALQLDAQLYQKQEAPADADGVGRQASLDDSLESKVVLRQQRTEQIDIPANQSIDAYREYLFADVSNQALGSQERAKKRADQVASHIVSFEGDIDPIQLFVLQQGQFVFVRKVWKARQLYSQGFLVQGNAFIQDVLQRPFYNSGIGSVSRLVVSYRGDVLQHIEPTPGSYSRTYRGIFSRDVKAQRDKSDALLYQTRLAPPFDEASVSFTITSLPLGPGATVVHVLAVVIAAVLLGGLLGIYRLASQQIKLADVRHDFVSAVSHELKTPLTSIRMYGEMLRSGWVQDDAKRQSYYDFIFFESERLSRLVANVLHLAKLTKHDAPLVLQPHDPVPLLELICSKVRTQVEAAGFALDVANNLPLNAEDEPWLIEAEEDALARIVINLVDNAVKFSAQAEKKVVRLELRTTSGAIPQVIFCVRDYGPGVARDQMKKIFQLFYRAGSELTRTTPGTGIGLALVKELTSKMDAEVDLRNHQPGAEFLVKFQRITDRR